MVNKPNIFCMKKSILLFYTFIQLVVLNAQNTGIYRQISDKNRLVSQISIFV